MKKLIPNLLAIIIGLIFSYFLFQQYDRSPGLKLVNSEPEQTESIYFIQQGVYSSIESMQKNTTAFPHYIYEEKDGLYYVFIGITKKLENVEKIKGFYKEKGYILYSKQKEVTGTTFLNTLEELDNSFNDVETDCQKIIEKYKELVLKK